MITVITYIMALAFQFMGLSAEQENTDILTLYFESCIETPEAVSYTPIIEKSRDLNCDKKNSEIERQTDDEYWNRESSKM